MPDPQRHFSKKLLDDPEARGEAVLARIALAKKRIQSVLDREIVAHQRTLEQKISEQGPRDQHVHPHLIGLAIMDLLELNRLKIHTHAATNTRSWYSNLLTPDDAVNAKLANLAPLYANVSIGSFPNLLGDALEIIVFQCLRTINAANPQFVYDGHFFLDQPKNHQGRYNKISPRNVIGGNRTAGEPDFIQFGHSVGPLCIECKNKREWLYPREQYLKDLIIKAYELKAIPVLVARRMQYAAIRNFLEPAGIIAHESLYHYYPSDKADIAARVKDRRSLGFTDVTATEEPHPRTMKFFEKDLPKIVTRRAEKWHENKDALYEYALDGINLAELYTAIGSSAGGKWVKFVGVDP